MTYIGADGNVTERRSRWRITIIKDIFSGILDAVLMFFRTVTQPPSMIEGSRRTTYAERNGINRSSNNTNTNTNRRNNNVRGVGDLSRGATAMPGGG